MTSSTAVERGEEKRDARLGRTSQSEMSRIERLLAIVPEWAIVGTGYLVYALLTLAVLNAGFLEYNADGYTRILRGWEWLQSPRWEVGVWLPLQTWIFGLGLAVYDSLSVTPRAIDALLTVWTLLNLYLIGRTIGGRLAGAIALLLGGIFPWVVWFSVSGMAEALFHATLSAGALGLVRWSLHRGDRDLLLGAIGFLLATMVRYEGWFYAAVFGALVVGIAWRSGRLRMPVLAIAALPMAFPLLWIAEHQRLTGDALGFAYETEAIKESLDAANASAGLLRRLTIYPEETFRLAPLLIGLCLLAVAYVLYRRVRWWPLVALVVGQGAMLVVVSAGFSNLGPGAERYLISNVVLLFPVLGAAIALLPPGMVRLGSLVVVLVAGGLVTRTTLDPPTWYPDANTRQAAEITRQAFDAETEPFDTVPVLLPAEPAEGFNAGYALRILSGHPDDWLITSDPDLFQRLVNGATPPFWVLDTSVDVSPPNAVSTEQAGRFLIGYPPPRATIELSRAATRSGEPIEIDATGFEAGEGVSAWLTTPEDRVVGIDGPIVADDDGQVSLEIRVPADAVPGSWAITLTGQESGSTGIADFSVLP